MDAKGVKADEGQGLFAEPFVAVHRWLHVKTTVRTKNN